MNEIHSKYKFFGGFGLILLMNLFVLAMTGFLTLNAIRDATNTAFKFDGAYIASCLVMIGLLLMCLWLLASQCRYLILSDAGITLVNPVLPFIRKHYAWSELDYFILVDEDSRYGQREAVWVIKDNKIRFRFSSFYYKNYDALVNGLKVKGLGKKGFGGIDQALAIMRLKKISENE